jgi:Tfp pilus assembly protein PilV
MGTDKSAENGITLVENVLALVIIAIVITGLIQLFVIMPVHTKIANHRVCATNLAQAKIEELKALGYAGIITSDYSPPLEEPVIVDSLTLEDPSDDLMGVRATSVTDITDGKKIMVTVTWSEFNKTLNETVEAVLYDLE